MIRPLGVDITHRVGTLNWRKARLAGVTFAFIKATHGSDGTNPRFNEYWRGAAGADVLRGACHCFQPHQDPHEQARCFARHALPGELPPAVVLDLEGDLPADALDRLHTFLEQLAELTGEVPLLQVCSSTWTRLVGVEVAPEALLWVRDYPLWVVAYDTRSPGAAPSGTGVPFPWSSLKWRFWRFSQRGDTGKYGAQSRYINLNLFNGSLAGLRRSHPTLGTAETVCELQQIPLRVTLTHLSPTRPLNRSRIDNRQMER